MDKFENCFQRMIIKQLADEIEEEYIGGDQY